MTLSWLGHEDVNEPETSNNNQQMQVTQKAEKRIASDLERAQWNKRDVLVTGLPF